ncbi:MAG: ADP-glyceromanno-heptose 6-epimerase [Candidatus Andersenbacteria bacterium]|nr:ADP-glyceromanno-heptose 6-epimerase [Candidatus Andersenbacteria bacterium]MBI3251119.1 ADP-glyceromanno-heptose 6-epimerase [Candidatus Andersenbacteria bacterium]
MIIVTGGTGFIGSATVWGLNKRGRSDVVIVDNVSHEEKEHNIASLQYEERLEIPDFREKLAAGDFDNKNVEAIIHLGANSSTTERDWDHLLDNNVHYTQEIIRWCADKGVRCVYASSGATYGDGALGFSDDPELFDQLKPLNLYGKSKLDVDIWARDGGYHEKVVGLRYLNVFGPNEYHKGDMASVIYKKFQEIKEGKPFTLFKSYHSDYADGESTRDFVYVKDVIDATLHFIENKEPAGVFNVGTGKARTWNDVAKSTYVALGEEPNIEYVEMPEALRDQYQYHTQADITRLKKAGFTQKFTSLEEAIGDYVKNYLVPHRHLGD